MTYLFKVSENVDFVARQKDNEDDHRHTHHWNTFLHRCFKQARLQRPRSDLFFRLSCFSSRKKQLSHVLRPEFYSRGGQGSYCWFSRSGLLLVDSQLEAWPTIARQSSTLTWTKIQATMVSATTGTFGVNFSQHSSFLFFYIERFKYLFDTGNIEKKKNDFFCLLTGLQIRNY